MDAETYMKHWEKNKVWTHLGWEKHQRRLRTCADLLARRPEPQRDYFADVGCAYGHSTEIMKKFMPATGRPLFWVGVDFSETAIALAKKFFPAGNWIYVRDPRGLGNPLYNGPPIHSFEGVVCSEVMEHVEDDKGLIAGLLGMCEKRLVLTTPIKKVSDPGHLRVYTEPMLHGLLDGVKHFIVKDEQFFYIVADLI